MEELTELSKNISDSYPDFVIGVESAMKKNSMQAVERGNNIVKAIPHKDYVRIAPSDFSSDCIGHL